MTSWRDEASEQTQRDLDQLLDAVLGAAVGELTTHGDFYPFGGVVDTDGELRLTSGQPGGGRPGVETVLEQLVAGLRNRRDELRATAVAVNVHVPALKGDAVSVELEHRDGQSINVIAPYSAGADGLQFDQPQAQPGTTRIWGEPS